MEGGSSSWRRHWCLYQLSELYIREGRLGGRDGGRERTGRKGENWEGANRLINELDCKKSDQ